MRALVLDHQGRFSPDDKADGRTTWHKVGQAQRNLSSAVDQRNPVMGHPHPEQVTLERAGAGVVAVKVPIANGNHLAPAGIDEPGIVDAGGDTVTTGEKDLLRPVEPKRKVPGQHLIDGLRVTQDMGRSRTTGIEEAVVGLGAERAGG